MKKKIVILMLLALLLSLTGCGESLNPLEPFKNVEEAVQNNSTSEIEATSGYSEETELIKAYLKCFNEGKLSDEFYAAYDYVGLLAYWISDNTSDISFHEAYLAISDLESGAEYISEHHPDFVRKYNENYDDPFGTELVSQWLQNAEKTRNEYDNYLKELSDNYAPIEEVIDEAEIWHSDNGYSTYDVLVVYSREEGSVSVGLRYIAIDGEFRWIMINETVGGYGG